MIMTILSRSVIRKALWVVPCLLMVLTSGCGSIGRSPSSSFYVLVSEISTATRAVDLGQFTGPRVTIGPVILPGYLDRNQMFMRADNAVNVDIAEFHLWGEPLSEGIVRVLCETVSLGLVPQRGLAVPWRATVPSEWQIRVDINRFDGAPGHKVVLDATWLVYNKHNEIVRQGYFSDSLPAGDSIREMVATQSHLMTHLGDELAKIIGTL